MRNINSVFMLSKCNFSECFFVFLENIANFANTNEINTKI